MSPSMAASTNRVRYAASAVFMQVLLGVIYSWSMFRGPLEQLHGWSRSESIAPYRYSLLTFAVGMIVAGFWQDRKGPRVVATAGGLLLGIGCLMASWLGDSVAGLVFSYGVVSALGVGFAYVTPIAMCIKWFPDHRGMIVGLAVMGFGLGPLVFGPLIEFLIGPDPTHFAQTIPRTFMVLGVMLLVGVTGAAQLYAVPPAGWRPHGWNPTAAQSARVDLPTGQVVRTWQVYALWVVYFLGTSVGLTAIGEATPLLRAAAAKGAFVTAGTALGIMSIFNGLGRLGWGSISDRFGRKTAVYGMCVGSVVACIGFLAQASGFAQLLAGLCVAAFCYGGYLALMPSFTADYFGAKYVGANYGLVFSAWGVCGFVVPGYFAGIIDRAKAAGNVATGYQEVYWTLAGLAIAGAIVITVLRPPGGHRING